VDWIKRALGWGGPKGYNGVNVPRLTDDEVAARQAKRGAEIAEARRQAFAGAVRLPMREVIRGLPADGIVYQGVDHLGRLIVVTSNSDPAETYAGRDVTQGWASFPHSTAGEAYPVEINTVRPDGSSFSVSVPDLPVAYPRFQPLSDERFLAVGGRCRLTADGPEQNALVIGADGGIVAEFCLGDGINDLQTTPTGRIWVSYNDEGVFGNYGWGDSDGTPPLGRSGLVRWFNEGDREFEFTPPAGLPSIADCYALNVVGEEAWACYYTDFPVVHVGSDGSATGWAGEVAGAHALAVLGAERVGLVGGYRGLVDRLVTADLMTDRTTVRETLQLVSPNGDELPQRTRIIARGQKVHALTDGRWLTIDLAEIPTRRTQAS